MKNRQIKRSIPLIKNTILLLTLMLSGRAMTLAFIGQAGGAHVGAPPATWLMPLIGDAIIGISALFIFYLVWRQSGLWVWTAVIVWNVVAIWDALSAYLIHLTDPWPDFFMIQLFGSSMFFAASAVHLLIIILATLPEFRNQHMPQAA